MNKKQEAILKMAGYTISNFHTVSHSLKPGCENIVISNITHNVINSLRQLSKEQLKLKEVLESVL